MSRTRRIAVTLTLLLLAGAARTGLGAQDGTIVEATVNVMKNDCLSVRSRGEKSLLPSGNSHAKPRRIVSANLGADQILMDLVPERMLSVSYLSADPRLSHVAAAVETVPHKVKTDAEQILALAPDLVVLGRMSPAAVFSPLEESGARVFRFTEYQSIEGIIETIRQLGEAVGEQERAADLAAAMNHRLHRVCDWVGEARRPGVLYYNLGGFTSGTGTFVDSIIRAAGGDNLAVELGITGSKRLSLEYLFVLDPDVLVVMAPGRWSPRAEEEFLAHPAVRRLRAFRERRIFSLPARYLFAPSHHVVQAVEDLARFIHPKGFSPAKLKSSSQW
jgi:iron complex transport system substrate-binding protein